MQGGAPTRRRGENGLRPAAMEAATVESQREGRRRVRGVRVAARLALSEHSWPLFQGFVAALNVDPRRRQQQGLEWC
eukprot:5353725-Pleurochrysis_carterae.AAC.1